MSYLVSFTTIISLLIIAYLLWRLRKSRQVLKYSEKQLMLERASIQKQVEEKTRELLEEQARLEASINSLDVGLMMTDTSAQIITINGVAKRALCPSKEPTPGIIHDPESLINSCKIEDIQANLKGVFDLKAHILQCISQQKPIEIKSLIIENKFYRIFMAPMVVVRIGYKLEIIGAVTLVEDITEEKIIERSKDEFFSIASHELRTPLTAIRGNTALIKDYYFDKITDQEVKNMIKDINESAIRLIEIVNDFLNLSRLEQGKIVYKNKEFDLKEVIKNVTTELENIAKDKKLTIEFIAPNKILPLAFADSEKVKQIMENLISNAIKYSDKGTVGIEILTENGNLKVIVQDTGRGISPEGQRLLFRKFQQTGENLYTRDTTKGTGLGLYISKLMIEGMGGKIGLLSSQVGKGSQFYFTIPAKL